MRGYWQVPVFKIAFFVPGFIVLSATHVLPTFWTFRTRPSRLISKDLTYGPGRSFLWSAALVKKATYGAEAFLISLTKQIRLARLCVGLPRSSKSDCSRRTRCERKLHCFARGKFTFQNDVGYFQLISLPTWSAKNIRIRSR